jgi:glutamate synthase domain-containing protein 3
MLRISAEGLSTRELNTLLREMVRKRANRIELYRVHGQRYIGTDLHRPIHIDIYGTPGNDLGSFMDGPRIVVHGNAQDGCGNTMNGGEIIVHGHAGDIAGFSMRGGKIFIRDDVGYRVGIHMKEYKNKKPLLVIGGSAQDFLGEYMAGGTVVLLGLTLSNGARHGTNFIGTGMHGGVIYVRGKVEDYQLGKEVGVVELTDEDRSFLKECVGQYAVRFGADANEILNKSQFLKLIPVSKRPYGKLYAY